jgi:hypothetical protein
MSFARSNSLSINTGATGSGSLLYVSTQLFAASCALY